MRAGGSPSVRSTISARARVTRVPSGPSSEPAEIGDVTGAPAAASFRSGAPFVDRFGALGPVAREPRGDAAPYGGEHGAADGRADGGMLAGVPLGAAPAR